MSERASERSNAAELDRGILAVRRVRSVREADSRLGLQRAVAERRTAGARVAALRQRLAGTSAFTTGETSEFLAGRADLAALGEAVRAAEAAWETSRTLTETARSAWQADRARLAAIDLLLERRVAERRAERERREARELDDLAAQRWLRARGGA
ncbi:MAG: flagellar FliJ family protein [Nocardioidaceae bacterium]|nr:flagellar FliJ family protein [Nocardioidaceae bacterium]